MISLLRLPRQTGPRIANPEQQVRRLRERARDTFRPVVQIILLLDVSKVVKPSAMKAHRLRASGFCPAIVG